MTRFVTRNTLFAATCSALTLSTLSFSCNAKEASKEEDTVAPEAETPAAEASPSPNETQTTTENPSEEAGTSYKGFVLAGSLNLSLNLLSENSITHVVALNPETGRSLAVPVNQESGEFSLPLEPQNKNPYIKADGSVNRDKLLADNPGKITKEELDALTDEQIISGLNKDSGSQTSSEATPWIISYVDATKTGPDMVVSRFKANTLDSIAPIPNKDTVLDLGEISPNAEGAETAASYEDILKATEMSAETAVAFGATDDVSLRYVNPDIDNDGKLDMPILNPDGTLTGVQKKFTLDFHNRFNWVDQNNAQIQMSSLKNKFPEDVVGGLENLKVKFTGSGIVPEMEKSWFESAPQSYKWKFSQNVTLSSNGSGGCKEDLSSKTLAAEQWCTADFVPNDGYSRYQFFREVATPPEGTYTLEVGGKTFTWTNVTVSDFSAGEGFLALMLKYNVDDKGTPGDASDDTFTGVSFKFMQKSGNTWVLATDETVKLGVKGEGGYLSLKLDGNNNQSIGLQIPKKASGEIRYADLKNEDEIHFADGISETDRNTFKAGNMLFDRCASNPGLSYDDKLGMRFFF